jgi:hypothetical protein
MSYNDVDFDYPSCGGVEVTRGRKWWTVKTYSNYTGNYTNGVYRIWINDGDTAESVASEYRRCPDQFECVSRGFVVQ